MKRKYYRVEVLSSVKTGRKLQDVLFFNKERSQKFADKHNNDKEFTLQYEYHGEGGVYPEIDTE